MKGIKIAIFIIIVCIILISITLIFVLNYANDNDIEIIPIEKEERENEAEINKNAKIEKVKLKNEYYTINNILQKYFFYINGINVENNENSEYIIENIIALKGIIDSNYYENKQISNQEIIQLAAEYKDANFFHINEMYKKEESKRRTSYFIYLTLNNNIDSKLIINTDAITDSFKIIPNDFIKKNDYNEEILNKLTIGNIDRNDYNKYVYVNVTDEEMAMNYFTDYQEILLLDPIKAYELLDDNYKEKRFGTITNFLSYLEKTKEIYNMDLAKKYSIENKETTKYICKNEIGMNYIFKEKEFMDYTVELDTYTIQTDEFIEKYQKADYMNKGVMNIDKFIEMLNMKDYTSAYNLLDSEFRNNYLPTQVEFENFVKTYLFKYNKIEYDKYDDRISGVYIFRTKLTDVLGEDNKEIGFNVIMKFLEGTDFVMSFELQIP